MTSLSSEIWVQLALLLTRYKVNMLSLFTQVKKFLTKHSLGKKGSRTERQVLEKMKNNMDKHISSVSDKKSDKIESWVKKEIKKIESKIRMNW